MFTEKLSRQSRVMLCPHTPTVSPISDILCECDTIITIDEPKLMYYFNWSPEFTLGSLSVFKSFAISWPILNKNSPGSPIFAFRILLSSRSPPNCIHSRPRQFWIHPGEGWNVLGRPLGTGAAPKGLSHWRPNLPAGQQLHSHSTDEQTAHRQRTSLKVTQFPRGRDSTLEPLVAKTTTFPLTHRAPGFFLKPMDVSYAVTNKFHGTGRPPFNILTSPKREYIGREQTDGYQRGGGEGGWVE